VEAPGFSYGEETPPPALFFPLRGHVFVWERANPHRLPG